MSDVVAGVAPPTGDDLRASAPTALLSARGLGQRHLVRTVRLRAEPGALLVTHPDGRQERLPVGPEGVAEAVHLGGPGLRALAPTSLGAVDLLGFGGARRARLDLRSWVPEADELVSLEEALHRSGLGDLLQHAGLPLRPLGGTELPDAVRATPPPLVLDRVGLPVWFTVLRSVAIVLCLVALGVSLYGGPAPLTVTVAAVALLTSTLAALALWGRAIWRDRPVTAGTVLRPHPGGPVSRRFLRTAHLRAEPDAVVAVDGLGTERRLPRTGRLGVVAVAVVRAGTPAATVELRTVDGTARVTLPWESWCGGPDGQDALASFAGRAGLALEADAPAGRRLAVEEHSARALYAPPPAIVAANALNWPHGVPGAAAVQQTAAFALLLLLAAVAFDLLPALLVLVLVLVLSAGLQVGRVLARRAWWDRPVQP